MQQADALLRVAGAVGHVGVGARGDAGGHAAVARIEPDVDLVVVEVGAARSERPRRGPELVRMRVLRVQPLLQARIVLLEGVAVHRIVQEEGEVGVEIEQRARDEAIGLERVAVVRRSCCSRPTAVPSLTRPPSLGSM